MARQRLAAAGSDRARRVNVYRPASASYYGPGLYGNRMACGGTLTPGTVGVAHKTLPCGTKVHLRYRGRTVTAPVIDRGPFVGRPRVRPDRGDQGQARASAAPARC